MRGPVSATVFALTSFFCPLAKLLRCRRRFSEIHKVGIIDIFELLKIEIKGEIDRSISGIIFISGYSAQIQICIRIYLVSNCLQNIHIRSYTDIQYQ